MLITAATIKLAYKAKTKRVDEARELDAEDWGKVLETCTRLPQNVG